ncbi:MAG: protein kinase, partial [Acidobacteriota bacterium]
MECPNCNEEIDHRSKNCRHCSASLTLDGAVSEVPTEFQPTRTAATAPRLGFEGALIAGKYRVHERIGRGGMGVVYKAEDTRLKREVALKFLPPDVADSEDHRERFLVEARAAAALSHPNICVIHEVGESEKGPFIAMEFVKGETLRARIKPRPVSTEEALEITKQAAAGLGEAHRKGIIHRDIKSANIMVTASGQVKIMDFGLAKLEGGSPLTGSHSILGTVAYMSPEQARGERVDTRTDLWSLGIVLYELLTGELPFKGERDLSILQSIIHEDPAPIDACEPPVPLELQRVVARALTKKRGRRYGSAEELLKDLGAYEEVVRAEATGSVSISLLIKRMRRPMVIVPAALALIAICAGAVMLVRHRAKIRWAKGEAIPEIARMIEANDAWRNLVPPYRLAGQVETIIPEDAELADLFSACSRRMDITTEPPGARVSMKEYGSPDSEWSILGVSPLEKVRVPIGIFRWKIEKEGFDTVFAAAASWKMGGENDMLGAFHLERTLDAEGNRPSGMVRVQATQTKVGVLGDFFIGRHEVTNREFRAFVDAGGYRNRDYWKHPIAKDGQELSWEEAHKQFVDQSGLPGPATWMGGDFPTGREEHPVSGVSWYEAAAYAEFTGMSLPTNAHWDVARGGSTPMIRWPQLGGFAVLQPFSNFADSGAVPVGSLQGYTAYGAHDMAGNVREWCFNEAPGGRVIRGGAFGDNTYFFNKPQAIPALDRSPRNGIRLASYPDPSAIPDTTTAFQELWPGFDPRSQEPVSDEVFQIYRQQFYYDQTPLEARVEARTENSAGWLREKVSFDAAYGGERVLAHLFLPANASPPYQTVIYFPGSAVRMTPSSEDIESYYEFTMFLSFLVREGRAVLFPVYQGTFERSGPTIATQAQAGPGYANIEYRTQLIKDFRRSIDYLETRPDIDNHRLAYYGMSWGGLLGNIILAVEERLRAGVLLAGGLTGKGRSEVRDTTYVTHVRTPTLMLNGKYDSILPPGSS